MGVLTIRTLPIWLDIKAADSWKLPCCVGNPEVTQTRDGAALGPSHNHCTESHVRPKHCPLLLTVAQMIPLQLKLEVAAGSSKPCLAFEEEDYPVFFLFPERGEIA